MQRKISVATAFVIMVAVLLAFTVFILIPCYSAANADDVEKTGNLYPDCGVVVETTDEWVVFLLQNGHEFAFENEDHDWFAGDLVSVVFDDMSTEEITDDVIVNVRYSGFISKNEIGTWIK